MMKSEERYKKLVGILRRSDPGPVPSYEITSGVMERISSKGTRASLLSEIAGFLFGWVNIGWVRRSLVFASFLIIIAFIFQQNRILRQIEYLSTQITIGRSDDVFSETSGEKMVLYRLKGSLSRHHRVSIPEAELEKLIQSVDELKNRYSDIMKLIDEDPELKSLVEEKLKNNSRLKIKL